MTPQDLKKKLGFVNHKSYGMYKELQGEYGFPEYLLCIDHVQGDPFAAPSRVRVRIPGKTHGLKDSWHDTRQKKRAAEASVGLKIEIWDLERAAPLPHAGQARKCWSGLQCSLTGMCWK